MAEDEVNVRVRPIEMTDYQSVLHLAGSLITLEEIAALNTQDPSSLSFVAEAEGQIVGFNLAHILYVGIPLSKICVIQGIVVDHKYRRLGIGEMLIDAIEKQCRVRDISTVRALVEDGDERLQQFAVDTGFQLSVVDNYDKTI
jgi:ribosomal protein S18 acetylase RimI-like enzyme